MHAFEVWLRATDVSVWVRATPWAWPLFETLHFIGLSLLLGVVGLLDLRLLGLMKRVPLSGLRSLLPFGIAGFLINLVTGVLFFVAAPDQYTKNTAAYMKLLFLIIAGLNALYFEMTQGKRALTMGSGVKVPMAFKIAGGVSLVSWFMVLYWGRMLPFVGNAF